MKKEYTKMTVSRVGEVSTVINKSGHRIDRSRRWDARGSRPRR
jgi:hypothetical protein